MAEALALVALAVFVAYGVTISPLRRFSWAMYSGSTKGLLWIETPDGARRARPDELGLPPEMHVMTLPDLARALSVSRPDHPVCGLIIGYGGNYLVRYCPEQRQLSATELARGTVLDQLVGVLRGPPCPP